MGGDKRAFCTTSLGRIDVGVCYTRGARSRRWCAWWGRRGRGGVSIAAAAPWIVLEPDNTVISSAWKCLIIRQISMLGAAFAHEGVGRKGGGRFEARGGGEVCSRGLVT